MRSLAPGLPRGLRLLLAGCLFTTLLLVGCSRKESDAPRAMAPRPEAKGEKRALEKATDKATDKTTDKAGPREKATEPRDRRPREGEKDKGDGSDRDKGPRTPELPAPPPPAPGAPAPKAGVRNSVTDEASGEKGKKPEKGKEKPRPPQVWKRNASRPTFARVYVGDGNALELVSLHVSVVIEGPRARTLVDHVFRNPHDRQLEGTFEYPLPAGASPSYFAMFLGATRATAPPRFKRDGGPALPTLPDQMAPAQLARAVDTADWGKLQEARIVQPAKALETYEEVVRGRVDPALLEYASGNTFSGRVFPIAPRGYNRVILAYEETLPVSAGRMVYRYALPTCQLHEMRFSIQADARVQGRYLPAEGGAQGGG